MYRAFYGLKTLPFQISTDPTFLWLGEKHREAISMLKYGIQGSGNSGLLLLTGDVGTGKTTLINALFKSLDPRVIHAAITNPALEGLDFFNYVAAAFGSKTQFRTKSQFLSTFERFLKNARTKKRPVLLVVDEAQLLSAPLLEDIRLFSNFESAGQSLINTFLVGQTELRNTLCMPRNRALRQRIRLNYNIEPLVQNETQEYIRYRLLVAGAAEPVFDPKAVALIHRYSRGLPREINIICDHALLTGYVKNTRIIDVQIIRECVSELSISPQLPSFQGEETMAEPAPDHSPAQERSPEFDNRPPPETGSRTEDTGRDITQPPQSAQGGSKNLLIFLVICIALLVGCIIGFLIFLK